VDLNRRSSPTIRNILENDHGISAEFKDLAELYEDGDGLSEYIDNFVDY